MTNPLLLYLAGTWAASWEFSGAVGISLVAFPLPLEPDELALVVEEPDVGEEPDAAAEPEAAPEAAPLDADVALLPHALANMATAAVAAATLRNAMTRIGLRMTLSFGLIQSVQLVLVGSHDRPTAFESIRAEDRHVDRRRASVEDPLGHATSDCG